MALLQNLRGLPCDSPTEVTINSTRHPFPPQIALASGSFEAAELHVLLPGPLLQRPFLPWTPLRSGILPYYPVNWSEHLSRYGICCLQLKRPTRHCTYLTVGGMRCNHLSLTLEGTAMREGTESPHNFSPTFWSE